MKIVYTACNNTCSIEVKWWKSLGWTVDGFGCAVCICSCD